MSSVTSAPHLVLFDSYTVITSIGLFYSSAAYMRRYMAAKKVASMRRNNLFKPFWVSTQRMNMVEQSLRTKSSTSQ